MLMAPPQYINDIDTRINIPQVDISRRLAYTAPKVVEG
jgi:hypothetical protein